MWISDTSIKRPVFATMAILSFIVLGLVSMGRLGIDLFPEVNFPFINIGVVFPGAAPEEVESLVTQRVEDAVSGINGVKRVISTSTEGFSRVGVELRLEVDPQAAAAEVREKVAAIRGQLPPDIEDPTIQRFDVAALPVMVYAVGSTQPSDRVRRQVEDELKPLLEQIDGVAAVEINGGQIREIQVNLDPAAARGAWACRSPRWPPSSPPRTSTCPGGNVERDGRSVTLRTKGEFRDADEIASVILRSEGGSTVRVRDVGTVVDGFEERETDDAPQRRRCRVVLGAQAVGREHRRDHRPRRGRAGASIGAVAPRPADPAGPQRRRLHQGERARRPQPHPLRRRRWPCWSSSCSCATGAPR